MKEKLKSPVVWSVFFTSVAAQLEVLENSESINFWAIAMAACTVMIALFGALNNPNDRDGF